MIAVCLALPLVNPFVGNTSHFGSTYPGAALPHSLVKLSPDTLRPSTAGYNPDELISGFSHIHIGGTAGKAFGGQLRVRPQTGQIDVAPPASPKIAFTPNSPSRNVLASIATLFRPQLRNPPSRPPPTCCSISPR
jgi:hypothetical protein